MKIDHKQIEGLVIEAVEGTDIFPVEIAVQPSNQIIVFLDADSSLTIDDCVRISRHIEGNLDRDKADFELKVSSFGVDQPLRNIRQYRKNIGRSLKILLRGDKKINGELLKVEEDGITIKPVIRKKDKKNPVARAGEETFIMFDEIDKAIVEVSFK